MRFINNFYAKLTCELSNRDVLYHCSVISSAYCSLLFVLKVLFLRLNFFLFLVYPTNNSLSGSETDICSSTENLSQEDRFVICNTLRQEPQGQENRNSTDSSYNTLIIHGAHDEHR